jgi:hypothetical protein
MAGKKRETDGESIIGKNGLRLEGLGRFTGLLLWAI